MSEPAQVFTDWSPASLQLLQPGLLLAGALLLLALALLHALRGRAASRFTPFALTTARPPHGDATTRPLPRGLRARLHTLPGALEALGLLAALLALARPVERVPLPLEKRGIDVMLCLDASSSMASADLAGSGSRLEVAREAARRFVAGRDADRIGLVRFAAFADLLCPPTLDHRALGNFLADVETVEPDSPEDLTGIGGAVARAAQVVHDSDAPSRVIILLTDGEENVARAGSSGQIDPEQAARLCREFGVRVYTIAVGEEARGPGGEPAPIDTGPVERLAARTGGAFFRARDAGALRAVFDAIDELETTTFADPSFELRERFLPFLLAGVSLLLLGRLLAAGWLGVAP